MVQTSWLDCGPAALTSLLRGFGCPAPYDGLRVLCNTGIDGTSINSIEAVAVAAGLDAVQMVVPVEQILALPERYLPGIIVTLLPDGFAHFVVLWSRGRRRVALMDPATGRRSEKLARFSSELYVHELEVGADMWREWAAGPDFSEGLMRRAVALGVASEQATELLDLAQADTGPHGLAALDAALRAEERRSPRSARGANRFERLASYVRNRGDGLAAEYWSCIIPEDGSASVKLRGAVLLSARSWDRSAAEPEVMEQLEEPEPHPLRAVREVATTLKSLLFLLMVTAGIVASAQVSQILQFRSALANDPAAFKWVVGIVALLIVARGLSGAIAYRVGRRVDRHFRRAWLEAASRLPASFIRSRPTSDIVFRAHSTHRLRDLPVSGIRLFTAMLVAAIATATIVFMTPMTILAASALFVVSFAIPWAFLRALVVADLRAQTLSGCLARPVADALLGAQAIRQKGLSDALLVEHDGLAAGWERALRRLVHLTALSRVTSGVTSAAVLAWCLSLAPTGSVGVTLSTLILGVLVIDSGATCAQILQTLPSVRSTLLRQSGPLNAAQLPRPTPVAVDDESVAVRLEGVTVRYGSVETLRDVNLMIPTGAHVAVVGSSGSGKSTLLSVILGLTEPSSGVVYHARDIHELGRAWAAPAARLWDGTVASNVSFASTASRSPSDLLTIAGLDPGAYVSRRVGEGGALLSDGEAQRVRLARALGRPDAPLVVLDEALRGLPQRQRSSVLASAREVWAGSTLFCALHEVADALSFDLVVVVEGGSVVEFDSPEVLQGSRGSRFLELLNASTQSPSGWRRMRLEGALQ